MLRENLGRIPIFIAISAICAMLLSSSFGTQINQGAWAGTFPGPNGQIAFVSDRDDNPEYGNREIYVMNSADGSGQTRLTDNDVNDERPSWSPDGEKIAFSRDSREGGGFAEIYVMNADGSGQTRLTENVANDTFFIHPGDIDPSWSPDGEKIAFSSYRDADVSTAGNEEIYVMNADGSEVTRLTNENVQDTHPSWSPNGEKIAFVSYRDDPGGQNAEIYVMNAADGSDVTRLTDNDASDLAPSWSPDGEMIAFSSTRDGNFEIYVMNAADGSNVTRLTTTENELDEQPSWSPDGTKIAFVSNRDTPSSWEIYVMNAADGSNVTRLTNNEAQDFTPDWGTNTSPPGSGGNGNGDTPAEIIDGLISTIQNLDDNVPQDVKTSLIAVLNEVLNILNDDNPNNDESACGTLDAFINQVNANETSDTLTADEADELSMQGEDIRNALDC